MLHAISCLLGCLA